MANFCTRGIIIDDGKKIFDGATFDAVEEYKRIRVEAMGDSDLTGKLLKSSNRNNLPNDINLEKFRLTERKTMEGAFGIVTAQLNLQRDIDSFTINFGITNQHGIVVCAWNGALADKVISSLKAGESRNIEMIFSKKLIPGRYFISCVINELIGDVTKPQSIYQNFLSFEVSGGDIMSGVADLDMNINILNAHED